MPFQIGVPNGRYVCLNYSKCKGLNITNRKNLIPCNYFLDNNKLEEGTTYKYLGVHDTRQKAEMDLSFY